MVVDPPSSARTLRDVAEIINRLWAHDTAGGRLFPGPVARFPRVAAIAPDLAGASEMRLDQVAGLALAERDYRFAVFLAAVDESLTGAEKGAFRFIHRRGFRATVFPCELLWEGEWAELLSEIEDDAFDARADTAQHLDRLFFLNDNDGAIEEPRNATDLLDLQQPLPGSWFAIVADSPLEAHCHVRDHESKSSPPLERCPDCYVHVLARGVDYDGAAALARRQYP